MAMFSLVVCCKTTGKQSKKYHQSFNNMWSSSNKTSTVIQDWSFPETSAVKSSRISKYSIPLTTISQAIANFMSLRNTNWCRSG